MEMLGMFLRDFFVGIFATHPGAGTTYRRPPNDGESGSSWAYFGLN
jgi:hypothetical protein